MSTVLLGTVAALAWGTHDFAGRFAARAVGHRLATLGVTLAGIGWLTAWSWYAGLNVAANAEHLWLLAVTGVGFALATLWLFAALAIGPLAIVAPIVGAYPVFAVFIALARGSQPALGEWAGMGVVLLGVGMVARYGSATDTTAGAQSGSAHKARVIGLAVLSSLAFALSITAGQSAAPHYGEIQATLLARCFGLVAIAVVVLWSGEWRPSVRGQESKPAPARLRRQSDRNGACAPAASVDLPMVAAARGDGRIGCRCARRSPQCGQSADA